MRQILIDKLIYWNEMLDDKVINHIKSGFEKDEVYIEGYLLGKIRGRIGMIEDLLDILNEESINGRDYNKRILDSIRRNDEG
jgi:hypothetical protein